MKPYVLNTSTQRTKANQNSDKQTTRETKRNKTISRADNRQEPQGKKPPRGSPNISSPGGARQTVANIISIDRWNPNTRLCRQLKRSRVRISSAEPPPGVPGVSQQSRLRRSSPTWYTGACLRSSESNLSPRHRICNSRSTRYRLENEPPRPPRNFRINIHEFICSERNLGEGRQAEGNRAAARPGPRRSTLAGEFQFWPLSI